MVRSRRPRLLPGCLQAGLLPKLSQTWLLVAKGVNPRRSLFLRPPDRREGHRVDPTDVSNWVAIPSQKGCKGSQTHVQDPI